MRQLKNFFKVLGIIASFALFTFSTVFSQSPAGFSYQAVARDNTGTPLKSQELTVRISIHTGSASGEVVWQEDHNVTTSPLGLFGLNVGGQGGYGHTGTVESFNDIDWSSTQYFLNVMVKKDNDFLDLGGSPIQTVPVAQFAQSAKSAAGNFAVKADKVAGEGEALFEVRRSDGSVAFAVYEDMVWVYAGADDTKGVKGGFAVGGYNSAKAAPDEYLRITPDSIRLYISDDNSKGVKGGFAVGGYNNANKGPLDQYLYVSGNNPVDDNYTIALGVEALASGTYSTAIGYQATAGGNSSFSAGRSSLASMNNAIAIGYGASSTGTDAAAIGYQSEARGERSIAIGSYYSYSFFNLPYFNFGKKSDPKGDFIIWDPIINPNFRTITFNRANIAEGKYSIALGNGNYSLDGGTSLGSNNDATGFGATAIGVSNKARNTNAFAAGYNSQADGYYATAFGNNTFAKAYGSFVIGQYNLINGDSTKWVNTDPLFVVGNGINEENRSNAFTIHKDGKTILNGSDASLTVNERKNFRRFTFNPPSTYYELSVFGVRSYINCSDPNVDKYYSAYFYHTGTENANYQGFFADVRAGTSADIAEYIYDTKGTTEPGDVLVADPDRQISAITSSRTYETSVIGVVSTEPHLTMGMELVIDKETGASLPNAQATRLALTGRVPCKVTDENGPIQPGDLLTSSSTPGHAMKWTLLDLNEAEDFDQLKQMLTENELRRNAVIGKALETHTGGTGKIMVLVSLQ